MWEPSKTHGEELPLSWSGGLDKDKMPLPGGGWGSGCCGRDPGRGQSGVGHLLSQRPGSIQLCFLPLGPGFPKLQGHPRSHGPHSASTCGSRRRHPTLHQPGSLTTGYKGLRGPPQHSSAPCQLQMPGDSTTVTVGAHSRSILSVHTHSNTHCSQSVPRLLVLSVCLSIHPLIHVWRWDGAGQNPAATGRAAKSLPLPGSPGRNLGVGPHLTM